MKRRFIGVICVALISAGCSKSGGPDQAQTGSTSGSDRSETYAPPAREQIERYAPPDISPTAAPGVAFNYEYAFELPDESIASVQEAHAARCESLGPARCRITGLNYSLNDDNAVSASLAVKLAPEIARQFGKDATKDVAAADGKLRRTEFTGQDTEPATTQATREQSDIQARIAGIEKQLGSAKSGEERSQLQSQLADLKNRYAERDSTIANAKQLLASTPMTFSYYGRGGISGFRANPVWEAFRLFVSSLVTMTSVILQVLAVLLPWAALLFVIYLVVTSRIGRAIGRFFRSRMASGEES
jgi:hypothetical protein